MSGVGREANVLFSSGPGSVKQRPVGGSSRCGVGGDGEEAGPEAAYRQHVRERLVAELGSERDRMRQAGRYRYEGDWLTPEQIVARSRVRRRREWARLLELVVLLLGLCGAAFVLYKLLLLLA